MEHDTMHLEYEYLSKTLTPQNYSLVTYVVSQLVKQWIHRLFPIILKFASAYTKKKSKTPGMTCKHLQSPVRNITYRQVIVISV